MTLVLLDGKIVPYAEAKKLLRKRFKNSKFTIKSKIR